MNQQSNQATKRGLILLLGVIIGVITGFVVAFVLFQKINSLTKPVVKEFSNNSYELRTADTIVKYVVHKYEPHNNLQGNIIQPDTLTTDSTLVDFQSVDFLLEDEDEYPDFSDNKPTTVSESKLISRNEIPVLNIDDDKNILESDEIRNIIDVQIWSTPIKNKLTYNFNGKILKIKGLTGYENIIIYSHNEDYILVIDKRQYKIYQTKDYIRLSEVQ